MSNIFIPRKVIAVGNSLAITIPFEIVEEYGIKRGDEVAYIVNDSGRVVSIDIQYSLDDSNTR